MNLATKYLETQGETVEDYYMSVNLAHEYLKSSNQTLRDFPGLCGELANELQKVTPNSHLVSVSGIGVFDATAWTYHTVVMVAGVVHDAWRKRPLPLKEWLEKFNGEWPIEICVDGVEVFEGLVSECDLTTTCLNGVSKMTKKKTQTAPTKTAQKSRKQKVIEEREASDQTARAVGRTDIDYSSDEIPSTSHVAAGENRGIKVASPGDVNDWRRRRAKQGALLRPSGSIDPKRK